VENRRQVIWIAGALAAFVGVMLYEPAPVTTSSTVGATRPGPLTTPDLKSTSGSTPGPSDAPPTHTGAVTPPAPPTGAAPGSPTSSNPPSPFGADAPTSQASSDAGFDAPGFAGNGSGPSNEPDAGSGETPVFPITADRLREAMAFAKYDINDCYSQWLKLGTPIAGQVEIGFTLATGGDAHAHPTAFKIRETTLQHSAIEGCIGNAIAGLDFESPGEELAVTYRLNLTADTDGPRRADSP